MHILIFLAVLVMGCQSGSSEEAMADSHESHAAADDPEEAIPYETMRVERKNVTSSIYYPASIEGRQTVKLIPRIEGYLQKVMVKEGAHVKRGQVLFVMDQATYKAEVNVAKANVSAARAEVSNSHLNVDSKKKLYEKNIISEFELRQAENQLKLAEAQLEQNLAQQEVAQTNLSYTTIKSPSDGVVGRLPYHVGDYIGPAMTDGLTTIADTKEMYIYFSLTERDIINRITQYGSLDKMIEAFPSITLKLTNDMDYAEKGRVESMSGVLDHKTGTLQVRAAFPNPDGILLSGGTGRVAIPMEYKDEIVIPRQATFEILNQVYVYKIVDGRAKSVIVDVISVSDGQNYVVNNGLSEGDVIISKGTGFVRENMMIEPMEQSEPIEPMEQDEP